MFSKLILLFYLLVVAYAHGQSDYDFGTPLLSSRIVGGKDAKKGEFPHQISLQWGDFPNIRHHCGGSILNNYWILTAAHCPRDFSIRMYVKAGKNLLRENETSEQVSRVAKSFVHKKYPGGVHPYDIALLKLERPLVFNDRVQPIALPQKDSIPQGDAVLSGWGSISNTTIIRLPNALQKAELPIIDFDNCSAAIHAIAPGSESLLRVTNVCTGPLIGGFSACSGDSGGPLIQTRVDGKPEVIGIASWAIIPCGTTGAPSVYTRVSAYNDWIETIMTNN